MPIFEQVPYQVVTSSVNRKHVKQAIDASRAGELEGRDLALQQLQAALEELSNIGTIGEEELKPFAEGGLQAYNKALGFHGLGPNALSAQDIESAFYSQPGIQFELEQGRKATEASAAARGLRRSGQLLKELESTRMGIAGQRFDSMQSQLLALSQVGQQAAQGLAGLQSEQFSKAASLRAGFGDLLSNQAVNAGAQRASIYADTAQRTQTTSGIQQIGGGLFGGMGPQDHIKYFGLK